MKILLGPEAEEIKPRLRSLRKPSINNWKEDLSLYNLGVLDRKSLYGGYRKHFDPVELRTTRLVRPSDISNVHPDLLVKDIDGSLFRDLEWGGWYRRLMAVRRQHNTRLNVGRDQLQRVQNFGDVGTGSLNGLLSTAAGSAPTGTTFTDTGATFPTATSGAGNAGLQSHFLFVNATTWTASVFGVVLSNSATVATVDQWYAIPVTGSAGTTPGATRPYFVSQYPSPMMWIALTTDTRTPLAADITRTSDGLWGSGASAGTATEQTANGLARAFQQVTFPTGGQAQAVHTWTYSTNGAITIGTVVWFNSLAGAGTIPFLETLLNATATVSASGDNVQVTWQVNY
jgi:hypothetical protein